MKHLIADADTASGAKLGAGLLAVAPSLATEPELLALIEDMLELEPSRRITAKEALEHPFFLGKHAEKGKK